MKNNNNYIFIFLVLCLILPLIALHKTDVFEHYALVELKNSETEDVLRSRLQGMGKPLFLIKNVEVGVNPGDLIRFNNKVVLIDDEIWQTLKTLKILSSINNLSVLKLNALAKSIIWNYRSQLTKSSNEKKVYLIGKEILKIFEDNFSELPENTSFYLNFKNNNLELEVDKNEIENLGFTPVRKLKPGSKPEIISNLPAFIKCKKEFNWQIWAVDSNYTGKDLAYSLLSELPEGLSWSENEHRIFGSPEKSGFYDLKIRVENKDNEFQEKLFSLIIKENESPRVKSFDFYKVKINEKWKFEPLISDPDNYRHELKVIFNNLPEGMTFSNNCLEWTPTNKQLSKIYLLNYKVSDPMGSFCDAQLKLKVVSNLPFLESVKFPLDSLIAGHTYNWQESDFSEGKVRFIHITGSDSVQYENNCLYLAPQKPGNLKLKLEVESEGNRISYEKILYVKENTPALFESTLLVNEFKQGQAVYYKPVIRDQENDVLKYQLQNKNSEVLTWNGEEVKLSTDQLGSNDLEFVVTDQVGNISKQHISYNVIRQKSFKHNVYKNLSFFSQNEKNWNMAVQYKNTRFGFLTTNARKTLADPALLSDFNSPFIFLGANLLGEESLLKGDYLYADVGFNFHLREKNVGCGGFMFRLLGKENYGERNSSFDYGLQLYSKQAILLKDSTKIGLAYAFENEGLIAEILKDYADEENIYLHAYLENWQSLPYNFYLGLLTWVDYQTTCYDLKQYLGAGLRYKFSFMFLSSSQSFKIGWSFKEKEPAINWTMNVTFNNWY